MNCNLTSLLFLAVAAFYPSISAGTVAVQLHSGTNNAFGAYVGGWMFATSQPIRVDALGSYDADADGLPEENLVGIWDGLGAALLTSTLIPSGDGGILHDSFRYAFVAPVVLAPGNYVIGGRSINVQFAVQDEATITTASPLTFIENRATTGAVFGLVFPDTTFPDNDIGFFGPNFMFSVVPEPASGTLFVFGLACAGRIRRRRNQ